MEYAEWCKWLYLSISVRQPVISDAHRILILKLMSELLLRHNPKGF